LSVSGGGPAAPWYRRVLWLLAIWAMSVAALGLVAAAMHFAVSAVGTAR
jgi:hypothetical protein